MASTVTSTPSDLTLSAGFNSTKSGKISWTAPTVPDGATIKSCVLTGKATASSDKVSSIKINNQSITVSTSGYNFTINLGKDNSITSVTATMTKSERWTTHTVNFTNMTYTVTYELASVSYTVTFKDWDGSVLKTQTVASGGSATPPSNPTRDGYTFRGWSGNYTNVTADVDIIAQYTQNSSGGDDTSVKNIKIGNSIISKLYLGTSQIVKVYLGDVLIFGGSDSGGSGGEITGPETIVENFTPTEDVGWSYRISGINWANHRIKITFDGTNLNTTQGNTLFSLTNEDSDFASTIIDFYTDDGGKLYSYESGSTFSDNIIGQTTMYIDKSVIKVICNGKTTTTSYSDDAEFQSYMNKLKANDTIYIRKNPNEEFANVSNITIVLEDMNNIGGGSA